MTGFEPSPNPSSERSREAVREIASARDAQKFGNLDAALQKARHALELDPQNDEALRLAGDLRRELAEVEIWEGKKGGKKRTGRCFLILIILLILVLLVSGLFWTRILIPGDVFSTQIPTQPTNTLTPSSTPIPTATGTAIPPTSVPTPTQTPTSIYANPWTILLKNPPGGVRPLFLLDDSQATFTGPEGYWVKNIDEINQAVGGGMTVVNQLSAEAAEAVFRLDQPLAQNGRYEIFLSDPASGCGSDANSYLFSIGKLDQNGIFIELEPIIGTNRYRYHNTQEQNPTGTLWESLGIYQFEAGDVVEVRFDPDDQVKAGDVACMDAVLIGSLPALPDVTEYQLLSQNTIDPERIVFWADDQDTSTELSPSDGWTIHQPGSWNWLGDASIEYNSVTDPFPQISWNLDHPLLPGKYQIYAWVSENQRGKAVFEISLGHYPPIEFQNVVIDLGGRVPALQLLGEVQIDGLPDAVSSNKIKVVMKPEATAGSGELAGDVILFIKSP